MCMIFSLRPAVAEDHYESTGEKPMMKDSDKAWPSRLAWTGVLILMIGTMSLVMTSRSDAQSEAALLFLRISPHARANGMGGAFVALSDQESPYYNPAGLGLFVQRQNGSFTFFPKAFHWLPGFTNDCELEHWAVNLGSGILGSGYGLPFSLGLGYYRTKLDFGHLARTDREGEVIESYNSYDRADNIVLSLGLDSHVAAGIGLTYKYLYSRLLPPSLGRAGSTYAFDFGALLKVPLADLLWPAFQSGSDVLFDVSPSFGICWSNLGPGIAYPGISTIFSCRDPLPKTFSYGAALETGISLKLKDDMKWNVVKLTSSLQYDMNLAGNDHYVIKKRGLELSIGDLLSCRMGGWKDQYFYHHENEWVPTHGFGLSLRGLILSFLWFTDDSFQKAVNEKSSFFKYVLENLDVRYEQVTYDAEGSPMADFKGYSMSIIF